MLPQLDLRKHLVRKQPDTAGASILAGQQPERLAALLDLAPRAQPGCARSLQGAQS
jgi:hypothetical protein